MKKLLAALFAMATLAIQPLFAQDAQPASGGGNLMQMLIMLGLAVVFFYFILWRPEQKRRKTLERQRSEMKKGDRVTAMGIVGTVSKIQEKTVILRMVDGSKIEVLRGAITEVEPGTEEELKKIEKEEAKAT